MKKKIVKVTITCNDGQARLRIVRKSRNGTIELALNRKRALWVRDLLNDLEDAGWELVESRRPNA